MRQQLPAHPRARTISADQHITRCSRSVVETRRDRAGGSLFEGNELLAEAYDLIEPFEQNAAQRDAAHGQIVLLVGSELDAQETVQPVIQKGDGAARTGAACDQLVEKCLRQALPQRAPSGFVDAQPVSLQTIGGRIVAFEDLDGDAIRLQPLRQAQPAGARADDQDLHPVTDGRCLHANLLFALRRRTIYDTISSSKWIIWTKRSTNSE